MAYMALGHLGSLHEVTSVGRIHYYTLRCDAISLTVVSNSLRLPSLPPPYSTVVGVEEGM